MKAQVFLACIYLVKFGSTNTHMEEKLWPWLATMAAISHDLIACCMLVVEYSDLWSSG
jgi:hypothetical protein